MIRKFYFFLLISSVTLTAQINNLNDKIQLAQSYIQTGEFEKAETIYKLLIAEHPNNSNFVDRLNNLYLQTKNYDASIALLKDRIEKYPTDVSAYGQLGSTYHVMDNKEEAYEIWNRALEIRPNSPSSYKQIAQHIIERRDLDKGIAVLETGREKCGKPDLFAYDLASLYTTMMKYKEAAEEYCTILLYQPDQLKTVQARISGYIFRADALEITTDIVSEIAEDNDSTELFGLLSYLYKSSGDYENAYKNIGKSSGSEEESYNALIDFAEDALNKKQFSIAVKTFEMLIEKYDHPTQSAKARIGLARTLEMEQESYIDSSDAWKPITTSNFSNSENFKKVIEQYLSIIRNVDNPEIKYESYYRLGLIYKNKFNRLNAADSLFQLIISNPPSANILKNSLIQIGKIRISQNLIDEALAYFERASQLITNSQEVNGEANYFILKSKFWLDKFTEALTLFTDFSKDLSNDRANDAIELSVIINSVKSDSIGLSKFAKADLLTEQKKFLEAAEVFKSMYTSNPGTILGEISKFKYALILVVQNELPLAIAMLDEIADFDLIKIYSDRALYLQGQVYQFGIKDKFKAINIYEKLLANFPNSLYLDKARENIIILKPTY